MYFMIFETFTLTLTISCALCIAGYHSDIPTFQVGPHLSGKSAPNCPCNQGNSTFYRNCGVIPKVSGNNMLVNGTHFGEFPWQVAVIEKYEEEFLCSGVLISPRIVLTAARCIQDIPITHIRVRLGDWDILNEDRNLLETYSSVEIAISKKYLHPEISLYAIIGPVHCNTSRLFFGIQNTWRDSIKWPTIPLLRIKLSLSKDSSALSDIHSGNDAFNLGILKMVKSVNFDDYPHIAPVCLPVVMNNRANLSHCLVTGWSGSAVKPLNEFIMTNAESGTQSPKESLNVLVTSTCFQGNEECHIGSGSKQDKSTDSSTLEIILNEVDGITEQLREKLEENVMTNEEGPTTEENIMEREVQFSRILWKSAARVLSRGECSKLMKDLNATAPKSNQLCVTPHKDSKPCLGDIGSPVICKLVEERKKNTKDSKFSEEKSSRFAVVGIITQSYSCHEENGDSMEKYPVLATSIFKSLDQICHVMSSSSKAALFKV